MKKIIVLLVLAAFAAGAVMAFKLLPWWALVGLFVAAAVGARYSVPWLFKRLLMLPFKAKGKVLRNARAVVHSVRAIAAPDPTGDEAEEPSAESVQRTWYEVDATITPEASEGPFQLWEPGDLTLLPPEAVANLANPDVASDDTVEVRHTLVHDGSQFVPNEGMKFGGEKRVRFQVGLSRPVSRCVFAYYFETFGEVAFPDAALAEAV